MFSKSTSLAFIIKAHRWLALLLSPVFLLILLSGAILAVKPMVNSGTASPLDVPALVRALDKVDPQGKAGSVEIAKDGQHFELRSRGAGPNGTFVTATAAAAEEAGFDVFDFALRLHKNLLVGAGALVEIATYVMVVLIISGLCLGLPKLRNSLAGWHMGLGWLGIPLVVITPLTGLLMALHLGMPSLPQFEAADQPLPLARAIETAAQQTDLSKLAMAHSFRRGATMLTAQTSSGAAMYIVSGTGKLTTSTEGPGWVRMLHEGTWAGAWSGLVNLFSALSLLGLLVTGVLAWWRRQRQSKVRSATPGKPGETTLVAFASQTGTAAKLAEATANALRKAGESVMLASLAALQPAEMAGYRRTLLIASTTGEGDLPDPAQGFLQRLSTTPMQGSRFSLLALGDKRYAQFCGGGLKLRAALLAQGAEEILPAETADGDALSTWKSWLSKIGQSLGQTALASPEPVLDQLISLQLVARSRLDNPQEPGVKPTWRLRFRPNDSQQAFRPGDLLLISPTTHATPRCYSVGSSSLADERFIDLTVTLHSHTDATGQNLLGQTSRYLGQELAIGEHITAQLRRHPGFNPPEDVTRPLILIATGAGIAPFPGFLAERRAVANAGPVWLFFGNRKKSGDFLHRSYFEDSLAQGSLTRLDTAFSRDPEDPCHIQQRLLENGSEIMQWMNERNAMVYICGGATTLGQSAKAAFLSLLAQHPGADGLSPEDRLSRWQADGRWRQDLFG